MHIRLSLIIPDSTRCWVLKYQPTPHFHEAVMPGLSAYMIALQLASRCMNVDPVQPLPVVVVLVLQWQFCGFWTRLIQASGLINPVADL